ncbi:helix-turn-helix domain-containing protein [Streptosporangium sp. NBC_01755]|uniref:PucR family transcriptional regulator n=1 Tax=Streptosporangium sp. NBC_01755 TaxID=2975949 RepID=UPI002DDB6D84|nr:helix-turn-helix domain-containing protein [Streptosporangium sp. NBC_01755]WSD03176.1 helix-turn-helix domain-containing protein [Streptosporangium sp. NBC_01755]
MKTRYPRWSSTLTELLDAVRDPFVSAVHAPGGLDVPIGGCVVLDLSDGTDLPDDHELDGAVVLLLGTGGPAAADAVADLARHRPGALVVKLGDVDPWSLRDVPVPVLGVTDRAPWWRLVAEVERFGREFEERFPQGAGPALGEHNDLFGLAKALGMMTGTLISIEDVQGRVLAFSPYSDQADDIRRRTILGREPPAEHMAELQAMRVYDRLRRPRTTVTLNEKIGFRRRLGVGMHDPRSGEYLGTVWAQETDRSFSRQTEEHLVAASVFAARLVGQSRLIHNMGTEFVQRMLAPNPQRDDAGFVRQLSLDAPEEFAVVAFEAVGDAGARQWLSSTEAVTMLTVHAHSVRDESMVAPVGLRLYAVLPGRVEVDRYLNWARRTLTAFERHLGTTFRAAIASSLSVPTVAAARAEVDRVCETVAYTPDRPVISLDGELTAVLLSEALTTLGVTDLLSDERFRRLVEYDRSHHSCLIETIAAYLGTFGDVGATARTLLVHPNTIRYRLARLEQVGGYRLDDPDDRVVLDLQLRLWHREGPDGT